MNFRLTAALFVGVLILVVALLVTSLTDEDALRTDGGLVPALALAGVKDKDVDAVELVRTQPAEEKLVFAKGPGGKWALSEPHPGKVDGFQVDRLVTDLFQAKPVAHPELSTNLTAHGLSPASVRVTLKAGDKSATVVVGETSRGGDRAVTFATTSDRPDRPVAVRRSDLTGLFRDGAKAEPGEPWKAVRWLADLRSRRPLGEDARDPATELTGFKLTAGGKEIALDHKPGGPWTFAGPAGGEADLNGASEPTPDVYTGVRPLLTAASGLHADGPDDFIEAPGPDLAKYGLNPGNPNAVRIEFTPTSGVKDVLTIGGRVEENGKPTLPAKYYARVEGDPAVMKLTTDRVDALRNTAARPGELRNKDLLAESLRDQVDAIDLTAGGATTKLRKVSFGGSRRWVLYGGPGDPQEANQAAAADLVAALTKPRAATDVLAAPYDAAFAPAEQKATLKLWANAVPGAKADGDKLPAEPAPAGTPTELVFGLKEPTGVLVRRTANGAKTDLRVPDALFAAAVKGRAAFLDPKFKSFNPTEVAKLTVQRGADRFELAKDGADWKFAEPADRKGKPADAGRAEALLGVLAGITPARVLAEQPTPDDLKKLGFDPAPRIKATVGLKAGDIATEFGAETEDKLYVAARQAGKPTVVAVPKVVADRMLGDDLRDRTLYQVDPAKVVGLKVRGWKGAAGGPQVLEFEKKGADWAAKSPPSPAGYAPDPAKLTALLAALAAPRADDFAGPGKVEYGLDPDRNPDAVEFTVIFPAPTPAVTLVLGGKTPGGDRVYAATSAVPGEAETFDPALLRPFLEKPTSLAK